jgi:multicomponent Na+:H+ antiporter subunit B
MTSVILHTASRFLLFLMLIFSFWVLFRGHNSPGGGFIAGLISASAFALYLITHGAKRLRKLVKIDLHIILSLGLMLALGVGLISPILGESFLTGVWTTIVPLNIKSGTPIIFDIGIYLVVVSSILIIMLSLEETNE